MLRSLIPPITPERCLGVVITGCDSGFGKEIALASVDAGYTVFAGCLDPIKAWPGAVPSYLFPLQMNVTKQSDIDSTVKFVERWLAEKDRNTLHALVNNAGVGRMGLIDWLKMESFEYCMNGTSTSKVNSPTHGRTEVNYFGLVRCCKSFLHIFKSQANSVCRIINITSMAGRVNGQQAASAYMASKHAANAFSHVLRAECRLYVQVSTINPTFHATPLVTNIEGETKKAWDNLDYKKQEEYGEGSANICVGKYAANSVNYWPRLFSQHFPILLRTTISIYVEHECCYWPIGDSPATQAIATGGIHWF